MIRPDLVLLDDERPSFYEQVRAAAALQAELDAALTRSARFSLDEQLAFSQHDGPWWRGERDRIAGLFGPTPLSSAQRSPAPRGG